MTKRSEPPFTEEQIEFWGLLVERLVSRALKASQENTDPLLSADSAGANQSGERDLLPVMLEHTTAEPGYLSGVQALPSGTRPGWEWPPSRVLGQFPTPCWAFKGEVWLGGHHGPASLYSGNAGLLG